MKIEWINGLVGGIIIGLAVSLLLVVNKRTAGISGIISGVFDSNKENIDNKSEKYWKILFIFGLFVGGIVLNFFQPEIFFNYIQTSFLTTVAAGLLVGFGTSLGSGCTSGHGICGISRFSLRSIIATCVFILTGAIGVFIYKKAGLL